MTVPPAVLHPLDYPGVPVPVAAVLADGAVEPVTRWPPPVGLADRVPVLAVGSNACAAVLTDKLRRAGVSTVVPVAPCRVHGLGVGHSAHVSARGAIPAAPFAAPGGAVAVHVTWLDPDQLAAVDRTEPNYRRRPVDPDRCPVHLRRGDPVGGAHLYVSRHGVLGEEVAWPLLPQAELHRRLAACGADGGVLDFADPHLGVARLGDPALRDALRRCWAGLGLALTAGL